MLLMIMHACDKKISKYFHDIVEPRLRPMLLFGLAKAPSENDPDVF